MSRSLRILSLLSAAALALALTAAVDAFGQSSNASADVQNSASPSIASSVSTPPLALGNYPIIVPPKSGKTSNANKTTNKTEADNNNASNATPLPLQARNRRFPSFPTARSRVTVMRRFAPISTPSESLTTSTRFLAVSRRAVDSASASN